MTRSKFFIHSVITAVIAFSLLPLHNTFAAPVVSTERPTVALNATVRIVEGKFGRANIVALVGGTLTIVNKDSTPYSLKVGATKVTVAANGKRTIPLPQRGVFPIVCAKAPALRAILTVR
jgi:plastocyanin